MTTRIRHADWVDATHAAKILGVQRHHVARLAAEGLLAIRDLPGVRARFSRADCERLALSAVRSASRGGERCPSR